MREVRRVGVRQVFGVRRVLVLFFFLIVFKSKEVQVRVGLEVLCVGERKFYQVWGVSSLRVGIRFYRFLCCICFLIVYVIFNYFLDFVVERVVFRLVLWVLLGCLLEMYIFRFYLDFFYQNLYFSRIFRRWIVDLFIFGKFCF